MTFLNAAFLFGGLAIAVPIVLHLIMRQRPKLLEFPALRFIQRRHDTNRRRLRLRHLLLLALRAAVIAILAMALARPSIKFTQRFGSQEAPVAAALVFDTAPHMDYRRDNKTRLDAARSIGKWLLEQLPPESQVAVCDSSMPPQNFDADRGLSKQRIDRLEIAANPQPLTRVLGEAARVLQKSTLPAKEIYIFTDLARASWPSADTTYLQDRLRELNGVAVYLIDVGVEDPSDFALGDLNLSRQVVTAGETVNVQTEISCIGTDGERAVKLELFPCGETTAAVEKEHIMPLKAGATEPVEFSLGGLKPGFYQGRVYIDGKDSLLENNERFFTIEVRPPWRVLIVANASSATSAVYLTSAIAPLERRRRGAARYECRTIEYDELAATRLDDYAAVCLLDPPGLDAAAWQRLTDYAAAGHGVGVFLGRHAQPVEAFNSPAAQQLLPGQLKEQVPREDGLTYLAPQDYQNPILKPFANAATRTPWNRFPVYRYWRVEPAEGGSVVISYNDGRPMLLSRSIGGGQIAGRVLMTTTPFSDRVARFDSWNALPSEREMEPWPFVVLANQIVSALVGSSEHQLNYYAGVTSVVLPVGNENVRRMYILTPPGPGAEGVPLPLPEKPELSIRGVGGAGNYCVKSTGVAIDTRGFSVNLQARTTDLSRLSESDVQEVFGPFKPQIARNSEQVVRVQQTGRVGREIYGWLIVVVAGLLSIEYIASNWFYKPE